MPSLSGRNLSQTFTGSLGDVVQATRAFVLGGEEFSTLSGELTFAIRLALEEAVTNAHRHGHQNDPDRPISVSARVEDDELILDISDTGAGFDPSLVPDPRSAEGLERPSGRGLLLIRAFMHQVEHFDGGRCIRMTRRLTDGFS